jgi:(4-(4-[2-(gamma-L-glutamylamino)ethyl]phenoxymethyl)furan-2-yl)methanamine synthase
VEEIAAYIYNEQVRKVSEALLEVAERNDLSKVVTTGLGMHIIGARASEKAGLQWVGMDNILKKEDCIVAPAIGTAILMEEFLRKKL